MKHNFFAFARSRGASLKAAVLASSVAVTQAHADIPAWATSMVTEATDDVTSVLALVGPAIATAVAGFLVIRLIKRGVKQI